MIVQTQKHNLASPKILGGKHLMALGAGIGSCGSPSTALSMASMYVWEVFVELIARRMGSSRVFCNNNLDDFCGRVRNCHRHHTDFPHRATPDRLQASISTSSKSPDCISGSPDTCSAPP